MNERKYIEEIEGLMVEITYEYTEDYFTPPTGEKVTIVSWKLLDESRDDYLDYNDEEWEQWMSDIDDYVHNDSKWNIIEYGH